MNPTFYKITVCQIITLFGNAALRFALPLYLLRRTDSAALYGSVTALALVPMLLGTLAGGVLADRCRKQKIMAVLDTVSAIGMAATAVILPAVPVTPLVLAALCLLYAVEGLYQPPCRPVCLCCWTGLRWPGAMQSSSWWIPSTSCLALC